MIQVECCVDGVLAGVGEDYTRTHATHTAYQQAVENVLSGRVKSEIQAARSRRRG